MVMTLFVLTMTVYVGLVIVFAKEVVQTSELAMGEGARRAGSAFQKLEQEKAYLDQEKIKLQNESSEIFTLYEITKEITKSLNEQEAFEIFKNKLRQHVAFTECLFFDPVSPEISAFRDKGQGFVFTLQNRKMKIGYLAMEGISSNDREKVKILGHQFALALRRVKLYEEIEQVAITDSLTELYTRRRLLERFREEMNRSQAKGIKLSFLMIDVDWFKSFNDQYGHLTGDLILKNAGVIIRENIREIDIAGRYGGEEFCVVLPGTDRGGAQYAAGRIRQAAEETIVKAYDTDVRMTFSIGTATYPEDGSEMDELIDKADWALYRAKKLGRNRVCSFGIYQEGP